MSAPSVNEPMIVGFGLVADRVEFPLGVRPLLWCSDCRRFMGPSSVRSRGQHRYLCPECEVEHDLEKVRRYRRRRRAQARS